MDSKFTEMMSSLLDGELEQQFSEAEIDALLREMENQQAQQDWDLYQHIGAALRGEEAFSRNTSLVARIAAQLEHEPAHSLSTVEAAEVVQVAKPELTPVQKKMEPTPSPKGQWLQGWRVAFAATVAAGMAALGLMGGSQLLTLASNDAVQSEANSPVKLVAAPEGRKPVTLLAKSVASSGTEAANLETRQRVIADGKPAEVVMLRDPEIDQYLLAHQRFSPSLYSTAQYARSATFATDKDK